MVDVDDVVGGEFGDDEVDFCGGCVICVDEEGDVFVGGW